VQVSCRIKYTVYKFLERLSGVLAIASGFDDTCHICDVCGGNCHSFPYRTVLPQ